MDVARFSLESILAIAVDRDARRLAKRLGLGPECWAACESLQVLAGFVMGEVSLTPAQRSRLWGDLRADGVDVGFIRRVIDHPPPSSVAIGWVRVFAMATVVRWLPMELESLAIRMLEGVGVAETIERARMLCDVADAAFVSPAERAGMVTASDREASIDERIASAERLIAALNDTRTKSRDVVRDYMCVGSGRERWVEDDDGCGTTEEDDRAGDWSDEDAGAVGSRSVGRTGVGESEDG